MALPRSTFVMGVAVAGVLALAIRGTATRGHVATAEEQEDAEREAARAAKAAQQQQLDSQQEDTRRRNAEQEELVDWTKKLVGAEVATFGGPYAGVSLPVTRDALFERTNAIHAAARARVNELSYGDFATVDKVIISPLAEQDPRVRARACDALERELDMAWGQGAEVGDALAWENGPRRMRATFVASAGGCELAFDHVLALDAWLAQSALIGKRHDQLPEWVAWDGDTETTLTAPGVGVGDGPTTISLKLRDGRVVGVAAKVTTDEVTRTGLAMVLEKQLGPPSGDADRRRWKGVRLEYAKPMLIVTRGETP